MTERTLLEIAKDAVAVARRAGAREAAAAANRSREVEVQWRDGRLDKLSDATQRGLALELYVDGRYSAVTTSDLRPEALARFVEDAVAMTRALAPDPHRSLPDPELYEGQAAVDLELEDAGWAGVQAARRRQLAEELEAAARGADPERRILSVTTRASDGRTETVRVHSNGFTGARVTTEFVGQAEVSVQDPDGRRPEDSEYAWVRHLAALPPAAELGRRATERALARLGARKGETARMTMIVEPRAAGRLVGLLLGPMAAAALQQKRSFLDGKLGQRIGSGRLDLVDDPHLPRGLGSRLFDGEGLAARRFPLFEGGVLRGYYVDHYYGRKLGMAPTTRGTSNLSWTLGAKGRDALAADAGEGVLVTGFLGGNSNATTGDFSLGVQGFRVRGGKLAEPVAEMNVSGNHLELWTRLAAVGNDPFTSSALRTPTLVFEGVSFAGV